MPFFISVFFGFIPMLLFAAFIYWLDRFEKEPVKLLGIAFTWGALITAGTAFLINTFLGTGIYVFTGSEDIASLTTGSLVAPIVEETLKGLAVLLVFFLVRSEFDSVLDGIVYSAVVALGFAATENTYYIFDHGYLQNGWLGLIGLIVVRVFLVGWQHPFYTAFFGIGLAVSRLSRSNTLKWIAPFLGWTAAVFLHSVHNTMSDLFSGSTGLLLTTSYDWVGWLSMLLFILWMVRKEKGLIIKYLQDEQLQGTITESQYITACSPWAQGQARWKALSSGKFRITNRFYQVCAEMAHKKNQVSAVGEETGNSAIINNLRQELITLSPKIFS